ncbi:hypothetical protein Tco_1362099 [Tanacetum coccineum]
MDSIIPLGQKNTLTEYMILSGADNRPPMLDKDLTKKYVELSAAEKIQADSDMKATNIILQGLPADIYSLERECKLYDAFDKFTHIKGETLLKYYLRFTQLINDMNIYKMKMEQFQVNTKFLNSFSPEWCKFVIDVKLVKDLLTTNFDKLHAYLEQHEFHENEVLFIQQSLALTTVSTSQYGSIHPTQHYSSTYPSQPQFNHSSVPPSYPYQSQMNYQTSSIPQIAYQSPQVTTQPMTESPLVDSSLAVPGRQGQSYSGTKSNATSSGGTMQEDRQGLLNATTVKVKDIWLGNALSLSDQGMQHDPRVLDGQVVQTIIPNNAAFQTKDLDSYDSDCDDISNAKSVLMANISNYGSDVISEVPHSETYLNDMENQSVHAMQDFE